MSDYVSTEPAPWSMMERHELIARLRSVSVMHSMERLSHSDAVTCLGCNERVPCSTLVVSMGVEP